MVGAKNGLDRQARFEEAQQFAEPVGISYMEIDLVSGHNIHQFVMLTVKKKLRLEELKQIEKRPQKSQIPIFLFPHPLCSFGYYQNLCEAFPHHSIQYKRLLDKNSLHFCHNIRDIQSNNELKMAIVFIDIIGIIQMAKDYQNGNQWCCLLFSVSSEVPLAYYKEFMGNFYGYYGSKILNKKFKRHLQ
ncbi:hypothetical protein FGO68_gene16546 [Halteria grandinella]|uniref:Uncharacterized protein n=1 Tax=Halteria grandinella TaxID=5974 RepID=A0A8J8SZQ8_HALGN|nr:hypothetical protein FGO68_gene16546 [Halteria grandinella]